MVRKLGGPDDKYLLLVPWHCSGWDLMFAIFSFISYRTGHYKLHYYETPTSLKFVMVSDTKTNNLRIVLHQIYVSLYVEYGMFCTRLLQWIAETCRLNKQQW